MAEFLQETIAESGFPGSANPQAAKDFSDFFRKVRNAVEDRGTNIDVAEIDSDDRRTSIHRRFTQGGSKLRR